MKKILSILISITILLFSASCSGKDTDTTSGDYPFSINGVKFDAKPTKVVSLSASITEIIYQMGLNENISGRSDDCTYPPAENRPSFGTQEKPDIDKFLSSEIEVVLTDTALDEEYNSALVGAGIKVLTLNPATNRATLKQLYINIGSVMGGAITGKAKGEAACDDLLIKMDDIARLYTDDGIPVCFAYDADMEQIATGDNILSLVIECAGGVNIALEYENNEFDKDILSIAGPRYILCPEGVAEKILNNPDLQNINAVANKQVYEIDTTLLNRQGETLLALTERVGEIFHPESAETGSSDSQ